MSVIVAVKENGVVYMGADSQTTSGNKKLNSLNEAFHKIIRLKNGILIGFCGKVAVKQKMLSTKDLFTLNDEGKLTKEHIVKRIIPKLASQIEELSDERQGEIGGSMIIAHEDSLYRISSELEVIKISEYVKIGAGGGFVDYRIRSLRNQDVNERILKSLVASAKMCESVSGPYVLIDTKDKKFKIIDLKEENY